MAKTIVTMTSWKKRISSVGFDIAVFFKTQTCLPDAFYLVLAEEEFPNKLASLPNDLLVICAKYNVIIKWCKINDFCFKRWYVYPEHYNDLVITIDDDILFDTHLVELAKEHINERNRIYNVFKDLTYTYKFKPNDSKNFNLTDELSLRYRWLGCSVVCPQSFPLDVFAERNLILRRHLCPYCDETWLKPFSIMNDTEIGYLPFDYHKSTVDQSMQNNATWQKLCTNYDGFQARDYQLFINLISFPQHLLKWLTIYPTYNLEFYLSKGIHNCLRIAHTKY